MRVQGYYPKGRIASPTPANLPWDKLSHLVYFSLAPTATGGLVDTAGISLATDLPEIVTLAQANDVKVLVTIGGSNAAPDVTWGDAISPTYRAAFVAAIVAYVDTYDLNGVDIDWEPFADEAYASDFALFIAALRIAMPSPKEITVFTAIYPSWKQELANTIQNDVDAITLSTYDLSFAEDKSVHDNPLYASGDQPVTQSVEAAVQAFMSAGVSPSKLNIGASCYAYRWPGVSELYAPATPNDFVAVSYKDLAGASSTSEPTGSTFDNDAKASYIEGDPFTSTPSVAAVQAKIDYVEANDLGGIAFWELAQGYFSGTTPHYPLLEPLAVLSTSDGVTDLGTPYTEKDSPYRKGYDVRDVGFLLTENDLIIVMENGGELEYEGSGNSEDILLLEFGTELTLETREPLTA